MVTVNFEHCFFQFFQLFQLLKVVRLLHILRIIIVVIVQLNEGVDERFQLGLRLICTDVCAPDDLSVQAGLIVHLLANHSGAELGGCSLVQGRCVAVRVESWCAQHAIDVHVAALFLEV